MTDFEMRIGPRKSPSPELRPVYQNKTWTRPRYRPPSQTSSPQKRSRGARRRLAPSPSRSDGDPALLLRMDFSPPYPSRSRPADHDIRRKPLSKRIRLPTMEDTRANSLTLGNHRVTTGSDHEIAMRRNPLSINRTPDQSTDNVDICTPRGQSGGSSVFSGSGKQLGYDPIISSSPRGRALNRGGSPSLMSSSGVRRDGGYPTEEMGQRDYQVPEIPWSHLALKDRIAPLVVQNANLRLNHDRHEGYNNHAPPFDDKNVDAVITADFCDSVVDSLITSASQLTQDRHQSRTPPPFTGQNIKPRIKSPTHIEPHVENMPPSLPVTSAPSSTRRISYDNTFSQQPTHDNSNKEHITISASGVMSPPTFQVRSESSTILPASTQPTAIPIPVHSSFFNSQPSLSSSPMLREYPGRGEFCGEESTRPRSPSLNPRPHKRLRSRSLSPSSSRNKDKSRSHLRNRSSRSPPPYHFEDSSSSYHRPHESPHMSHRSRSPRSRRSRSPPSHGPESPRSRETGYSNRRRQTSITYHQGFSPFYSQPQSSSGYSHSHHSTKENSDITLPVSPKAPYNMYPPARNTREPYLTAFEREQHRERLRRNENKGYAEQSMYGGFREEDRGQRQRRPSTNQLSVDENTTLPRRSVEIMGSATSAHLPTAPASAVRADGDGLVTARQANGEHTIIEDSAKMAVDNVQFPRQAPLQATAQLEEVLGSISNTKGLDASQAAEVTSPPWRPFDDVPGIWLLKNGSVEPEVFEHSFEISKDFALKWNLPLLTDNGEHMPENSVSRHLERNPSLFPMASWKLKCVPLEMVDPVRPSLENPATAEDLVQELIQFRSNWPTKGKLIIEVNPQHVLGKTFYAKHLDSTLPFVELKYHIHEGANLIRFIQLGDTSKHVFILYTTPMPSLSLVLSQDLLASHHELSLDTLQRMLQKSRLDNCSLLAKPSFGVQSANVNMTFANNTVDHTTTP